MAVYLVGEDVRDDGFKSDAAVREVSACELFGRDAQRRRDWAMPQNPDGRAVGGNGVEFAGVKPALDAHPVAGGDFAVGLRRVVPAGHAEAAVLHGEGQLVLRPQTDDGCRDVERPPELPSDLGRAQFGDCRQGWLRIACRRPRGQENEGNGEKRHRANYTKTPRIARAGETNRVTLLIGKAYAVSCLLPVSVVGASDPEVEVGRDGARTTVRWPVRLEYVDAALASSPRAAGPAAAAAARRGR